MIYYRNCIILNNPWRCSPEKQANPKGRMENILCVLTTALIWYIAEILNRLKMKHCRAKQ